MVAETERVISDPRMTEFLGPDYFSAMFAGPLLEVTEPLAIGPESGLFVDNTYSQTIYAMIQSVDPTMLLFPYA